MVTLLPSSKSALRCPPPSFSLSLQAKITIFFFFASPPPLLIEGGGGHTVASRVFGSNRGVGRVPTHTYHRFYSSESNKLQIGTFLHTEEERKKNKFTVHGRHRLLLLLRFSGIMSTTTTAQKESGDGWGAPITNPCNAQKKEMGVFSRWGQEI